MTQQYFSVRGSGWFPLDMLRYDRCYPASQEDVSKIDNSGELKGERVIELCRIVRSKNIQPTADRWASFGWTYLPQTIRLYSI